MHTDNHTQALLKKYILNQCTKAEVEEVITFFQDISKSNQLPTVEDVLALLDVKPIMNEADANRIYANIIEIVDQPEKQPIPIYRKTWLKYAAAAILVIGLGYFYQQGYFNSQEQLIIANENITLELDNGNIEILNEDGSTQVVDAKGNVVGTQTGNQLIYNNEIDKESLVYNTLTVPYGKRFELNLSDGTHVYLNAGSSMRYPVKFLNGLDRQVFLKGEAFFEVSKDKEHPFIVNAQELKVQVLGTEFNISAYPEDADTNVVLVEGSVGMYASNNNFDANKDTILIPGNKGAFNNVTKTIKTSEVSTSLYTSWVRGDIVFRDASFNNIITKLERLYNVTIINNKATQEKTFNASINVDNESIEEVLDYFNIVYQLEYQIVNNKIIIE